MKRTILLLTVLLLGTQSFAQDISVNYSDSNFEEIFKADKLESIEMWEQPRTQYTPKNLVKQQQIRFNGRTSKGVTSYTLPITDYDTKIVKSYLKDGKFYIEDNLGRVFQTGEFQQVDTSKIEKDIQNNTTQINKNTKAIKKINSQVQSNTQNINALRNDVSKLNTRMDGMQSQINRLDDKIERGLATVTALTALHPNPRHQGRTQISIGTGMYSDNVAGAVGVFHYLNDKVMLSAGASYGGNDSFAGNVGITIGF